MDDHRRPDHCAEGRRCPRSHPGHLTRVVPGKTCGPRGYRQFVVNGVPVVIQGGGWSQDMFLRNTAVQRREPHGATPVVIRLERRPAGDPASR